MRKLSCLVLAAVLMLSFVACSNKSQSQSCTHDYYLSDYTAPTSTTNGSNQYTCKICGNTYTEVISATGDNITSENKTSTQSTDGYGKNSSSVTLFDLPVYSNKTTGVDALSYRSEITDTSGYKHKNVYEVCGNEYSDVYYRYELNGKYNVLTGTLYAQELVGIGGSTGWLEFYDGDDFIYSTGKVSDSETDSVDFSVDITGVDYLTVYLCADGGAGVIWMILDPITLSK